MAEAIDLKADVDLLNAAVDGKASLEALDKLARDLELTMRRLAKVLAMKKKGKGTGTTPLATKCLMCGVARDADPAVSESRSEPLRRDSNDLPTGVQMAPERYRQASLHSDSTTYGEESLAEMELSEYTQLDDGSFYAEEGLLTSPSPYSGPRTPTPRPGSAPPPRGNGSV